MKNNGFFTGLTVGIVVIALTVLITLLLWPEFIIIFHEVNDFFTS